MTGGIDQTLVVGASGRVGRMLAHCWAAAGQRPILQHRGTSLPSDLTQLGWQPLGSAALEVPAAVSAMIVLAGVVPGHGDLAVNAALAKACLRAAQRAGIARVLLASSSAVYGLNAGMPCRETDPTVPVNDYGRAKLDVEAVAALWRTKGLAVTCLRIGNVAGADALLANRAAVLPVDRFGDGRGPLRSYIGAQTMARVLAELVALDLPDVLNLAAPYPVDMAELAQASGRDWHWQPAPETAHQRITLECSRLAGLVAFTRQDSQAVEMVRQARFAGAIA